jgi:hypothetical protein
VPAPQWTVDLGNDPKWRPTANLSYEKDADYVVSKHTGSARKRHWVHPLSSAYAWPDPPPPTPGTEPVKNCTLYVCINNQWNWIGDFEDPNDANTLGQSYTPSPYKVVSPFDATYALWNTRCTSYGGETCEK